MKPPLMPLGIGHRGELIVRWTKEGEHCLVYVLSCVQSTLRTSRRGFGSPGRGVLLLVYYRGLVRGWARVGSRLVKVLSRDEARKGCDRDGAILWYNKGMTPPEPDLLAQTLQDAFGFDQFRPLQEEAVRGAVAGRDVLVVMPTGAGKSLCFQLPALVAAGVTLVISPLIALMRDQVDALNRREVFEAAGCASLSSLQDAGEQRAVMDNLRGGRLKLLYVAPERFRSPSFLEALKRAQVSRFVVDEAHCISEWGHDFRPDYLSLRGVVDALGRPPITAVTATATRRVQESIVDNLGMEGPLTLVGGFNRPNLHWAVVRVKSESERLEKLAKALPRLVAGGGSGLIYVSTRKMCDEVAEVADDAMRALGLRAGVYHAGLDGEMRTRMQQEWLAGQRPVLVATNAFGMGIDKSDVRFVVHCGYPDSLESYYQEAGRAGRDGQKSRAVVLTCFTDRRTREWFLDNDVLTVGDVQAGHRRLIGQSPGEIVTISRYGWTQAHEGSDIKGRRVLGELERAGLVERLNETPEEITLRLVERKFSSVLFGRIARDLDKQRRERLRRLDEMSAYTKTDACRRRTILEYFGDHEEPQSQGFCCDNCDRPPAQSGRVQGRPDLSRLPMPGCVDGTDFYSVLEGLDALRPSVGKARLNQLLRGASSRDVERYGAEGHPLFGALRHGSRDQVTAFLDALIAQGLLHQADEEDYFVCSVTQAGRDTWQGRLDVDIALPGARRVVSAGAGPRSGRHTSENAERDEDAGEMDEALFERLRSWRRLEARAQALSPAYIFTDKTLRALARQQPQSLNALRAVSGVGDAKLEKYGQAVLSVMQAHEAEAVG